MPNDSGGQFPSPPTSTPVENQPTYQNTSLSPREISLTDEVAPDLTTPPAAVIPTPEPEPTPAYRPEPAPMPIAPSQPQPATIAPSRPFPIVTILLLFVSVGAIAAAYFFYRQNTALNQQISQIEKTLEQQRIQENRVTPTPTPTLEPSPTGTASATPTLTPTPTISTDNSVFGRVTRVLATATAKYPAAQLIMITVTGFENPTTAITKYWFRQAETNKRYLYILAEDGKDLALVDQQVYVTPDDNIPSLNQLAESGKLGLDLTEAVTIAAAACPPNFSCNFTPISGQYIKAGATLWQVSYKPTNGSKPFVVQIDSLTKKILYKNQ